MAEYSEYKESGQQWLGKVPSHWGVDKISAHFQERKTIVSDVDFKPLSVTKNGVVPQLDTAAKSDNGDNRKLVRSGDFVVNSRSDRKGSCGFSNLDGSVSVIYIVATPIDVNGKFYHYLFRSNNYVEEFYRNGHGIVADLWTTKYDEMKNIQIPIPPKEEQEAIVAYLDKVTADIDKAIDSKERIISSLEERRKIIITHAVTRGINPDAPLKDSGIDWLGQIPAHWEVIRIKYLLNEKKLRSKTGAEEPLSMSQRKGLIPTKMMGVIPNLAASYVDAKLVSKGDLVFNKLKAHLGVFNVSEYDGLVSPDYAVYNTTGNADLKFLEYVFKTPNCISEFKKLITGVGSGLSRLYTNDLYSIFCAIPPIDEQLAISNHIVNHNSSVKFAYSIEYQ